MGGINFYLNKNKDSGLIAMIARDSGHTEYPLLVMHDDKV